MKRGLLEALARRQAKRPGQPERPSPRKVVSYSVPNQKTAGPEAVMAQS